MRMKQQVAFAVLLPLLAACGGPSVYGDEAFVKESPYQRKYGLKAQQACEGAQLALLSQAYRMEKADALQVRARKDFQPEDDVNITVDFEVICKDADTGALVFVNAVETTYELKKTSGSTSLSIPAAGSFSLPWSKSADSLVKVAGKTITDPRFYARFFDLVASYLKLPSGKSK